VVNLFTLWFIFLLGTYDIISYRNVTIHQLTIPSIE